MMEFVACNPESKMRDQFLPGAFVGTILLTSGILDTVNIYHGVSGCHAMVQHLRCDLVPNGQYVPAVGTGFLETEAIMGGAAKLERTIRDVVAGRTAMKQPPQCIWISLSDCPAIGGEDIEGVARQAVGEAGVQIVAIPNAGFQGGVARGAELGLCKILDEVVKPYNGKREGLNIIAPFLMGSANWPFDIDHMVQMLEASGVKINMVMARNIRFSDLQRFPHAAANLVLSYEDMPDFERRSDALGVPTIHDDVALPYGLGNTEAWLLNLAERFGKPDKAKKFLEEEMVGVKKILYRNYNFSWMASFLSDKYAAVYGYAPFAAALTRYLFNDLNLRVKVVGLLSETAGATEKAKRILEPLSDYMDFQVYENPTYFEIGEAVKKANPDFVVGAMQDKALFKGLGIAHLNLAGFYYFNNYNFVPWPLVGVRGSLRLFSEICRVVEDAFYETEAWKKLGFTPGAERD